MMISNSTLHTNDPPCSSLLHRQKHRNGARCSKEVISNMCGHMAQQQPSSSAMLSVATQFNDEEGATTSDDAESPRTSGSPFPSAASPSTPHPFSQAVGFLYNMEDFEVLEMLGEGFFSKVLKVRNRDSGEEMVLKVSKMSAVSCRRAAHADASREAGMLRRLQHENILELKGLCIERCNAEWDLHLLVDYCAGGSLNRYILDRSLHFPWAKRVRLALEIAGAMEFIHSQRIIHRDLTSMNVLLRKNAVSGEKEAVVADFGLSCRFPRRGEKLPQVGTTYFMSPECLKEEFYDEKSDVFSFGVILCQLIARIDADPDSGLHRTSNFGLDYILFTPCCPPDTPIELLKLAFNSCLLDPAWRPSFASIVTSLKKMVNSMPSSPSMERQAAGKDPRLGRSRSDAALRKPKGGVSLAAARKLSNTLATSHCRPVIEGMEADEDHSSITAMKELARDKAKVEPSNHKHTNPFRIHERFRTQRKIFPRFGGRRRSETKPEPPSAEKIVVKRWLRRRCSSLPAEIDSENFALASTSSENEAGYDEVDGTPGGIPMAFRDYDLKFVKSMKRFPSRRHTMIPECSGIKSTIDLQKPYDDITSSTSTSGHVEPDSPTSKKNPGFGVLGGGGVQSNLSPVTEAPSDDTPEVLPVSTTVDSSLSSCSVSSLAISPGLGDRLNNNHVIKKKRAPPTSAPTSGVDSVVSRRSATRFCTSFNRRRRSGSRSRCVIL